MIINSLHLRNIRSYIDERIDFRQGATLLAGDIGSGKTTILLAIEFAIFGIMKGIYSGTTLLRNGENSGFVELAFRVDDKQVTIRRFLKRTKTGVSQDAGTLIINGESFDGTAQELKSRVLDLLGYPESLLSKSKSLIFRYTVFTPQEEMKSILYEGREERLDILRRLFNIDKYKRVKENTMNYARELKGQVSFLEGKLEGLPGRRKELEVYSGQVLAIKKEIELGERAHLAAVGALRVREQEAKEAEALLEQARKLEQEVGIARVQAESAARAKERCASDIQKLKQEIEAALAGLKGFDASRQAEIQLKVSARKEDIRKLEKSVSEVISKQAENSSKRREAQARLDKITSLDVCPTCMQQVAASHIDGVKARENHLIHACESNLEKLSEFEKTFLAKKESLEAELEKYSREEQEFRVLKVRFEGIEEKKRRREGLELEISKLDLALATSRKQLAEAEEKAGSSAIQKVGLEEKRKALEEARRQAFLAEKSVAERKSRLDAISRITAQITEELAGLEEEAKRLSRLKERRTWLEEDFVGLVDLIEKNVLSRVYNEFNGFFQSWFDTLIEDETIKVRLDEYFAPAIEQNGHETFIENLSGGERTSVALAYRLALNKVVNDFLSSVRTRDLIILDEPTEGFSTDQLDRVREVLGQADLLQTIIVSHESKMEGFVDHVIRIQKQTHVSRVFGPA